MSAPNRIAALPLPAPPPGTHDTALVHHVADRWADRYLYAVNLGWHRQDLSAGVWVPVTEKHATWAAQKELELHCESLRQAGASTKSTARLLFTSVAKNVTYALGGNLEIHPVDFDSDPFTLNCPNGVVDLRTGRLRPHLPSDRFRKSTKVDYDPDAGDPRWEQALQAVPDEVRPWLQTRLGQALVGRVPADDRNLFLRGGGSNGKTLIIRACSMVLGSYAMTVSKRLLIGNPGDHPTEFMDLLGARMAVLEEMPDGRHLNANALKQITGSGEISARRMRQDTVLFPPTHTLFITTNHDLSIADVDEGIWRRLWIVPFPYHFVDEVKEVHHRPLDRSLRDHFTNTPSPTVLAWLVEGAVRSFTPAFTDTPLDVMIASDELREDNDVMGEFLAEHATWDENGFTSTTHLTEVLGEWLQKRGREKWSDKTATDRLKAHALRYQHPIRRDTVGREKSRLRGWRGVVVAREPIPTWTRR